MRDHLRVSSLSLSSSTVNPTSTESETSAPRLSLCLSYRTVFTVASASSVMPLACALGSTFSPLRLLVFGIVVGGLRLDDLGHADFLAPWAEIFFLQCVFRVQVASLIRHHYHAERGTMLVRNGLWSSTHNRSLTHWEAQTAHRL